MEFVKNPLIGSDIEFFVANPKTLKLASAEGFIPGTKKEPAYFVPGNKYFATQLDNVLAEGNIPPANTWTQFLDNIIRLRTHMNGLLEPHALTTVAQAAGHIPEKFLQTENAKTFGCDESFNCWTNREEPVTPTSKTLRSAGFHIHIGYENPRDEINIALARIMDYTIGLHSIAYEVEPKSRRREVGYGKAGNFRHQPHGVEYRSLSSSAASQPYYIRWAYGAAMCAATVMNSEWSVRILRELSAAADEIQNAINTHDVSAARALQKTLEYTPAVMYGMAACIAVRPSTYVGGYNAANSVYSSYNDTGYERKAYPKIWPFDTSAVEAA